MKILVTGGCGFIGSNFILQQCSISDNQILNIDKLTYSGNIRNLSSLYDNENYKFIEKDICDKNSIIDIINEFAPDWIVHFAAETHVDRSIDGPENFIKSNILGVFNLLEQCRRMSQFRDDFKKFIQIPFISWKNCNNYCSPSSCKIR